VLCRSEIQPRSCSVGRATAPPTMALLGLSGDRPAQGGCVSCQVGEPTGDEAHRRSSSVAAPLQRQAPHRSAPRFSRRAQLRTAGRAQAVRRHRLRETRWRSGSATECFPSFSHDLHVGDEARCGVVPMVLHSAQIGLASQRPVGSGVRPRGPANASRLTSGQFERDARGMAGAGDGGRRSTTRSGSTEPGDEPKHKSSAVTRSGRRPDRARPPGVSAGHADPGPRSEKR
jgi:hypothetical protein